jgi:hypothetical protein
LTGRPSFIEQKTVMKITLNLRNLAAEATADFRRDHAQAVFGDAAHERHDEANDVRILRGIPQRQLARRGQVVRERAARLHRRRNETLLNDAVANDDVGLAECGIDVATQRRPSGRQCCSALPVQLRCAGLNRLSGSTTAVSVFVIDFNEIDRIGGLFRRVGDDDSDRVTDVSNGSFRQRRVRRGLQIRVRHEPRAGD